MSIPAGSMGVSHPAPLIAPIGGVIIVPVRVDGSDLLACVDTANNGNCAGAWPAPLPFAYGFHGAVFPLLNASGAAVGLCVPNGSAPCFSLAGASVASPAGLGGVIGNSTGYNGPAMVIGARVYVPNGNTDRVNCYDYAANASCANFPHALPGLSYLYTVNPDPQRPACIWVNADNGAGQIQNFDAFSGSGCGEGPVRVLASTFVPPVVECTPLSYTKLQVLDPPRAAYASGVVAFRDGSGNPIAGVADAPLDNAGSVALSGLNLTANGLPQFLITLNGLSGPPGSVTVELTWTGANVPACGGDTTRPGGAFSLEATGLVPIPRQPYATCPPGASLTQVKLPTLLGEIEALSAGCSTNDGGATVAASSITKATLFGGLLRIEGVESRCTSAGGVSSGSSKVGTINGRTIGTATGSLTIPGVARIAFNETVTGADGALIQNAVRITKPGFLGLLPQEIILAGCYFT